MPSIRSVNLLIFLASLGLIIAALYFQHVLGLPPCYLCITQRVFVILVGAIGLLAFLHNPGRTGQRCYHALLILSAATGGFFSGKQLWLQSLPEDQVPACGPPPDYLFDAFPFQEALAMLLRGDGNCAKVHWTFLDISMPGWVLLAFCGFIAVSLYQIARQP